MYFDEIFPDDIYDNPDWDLAYDQRAKLKSPKIDGKEKQCLKFYYHMEGQIFSHVFGSLKLLCVKLNVHVLTKALVLVYSASTIISTKETTFLFRQIGQYGRNRRLKGLTGFLLWLITMAVMLRSPTLLSRLTQESLIYTAIFPLVYFTLEIEDFHFFNL